MLKMSHYYVKRNISNFLWTLYFCTSCAIKVQKSKKPCPKCGTTYYKFFPDTEKKKYIGALRIYCTNNSKGCAWNGQLRNLQYHIRENSRHGECQFEVVRCRYLTCSVKLTRNALEYHEDKCHLRACQCKYTAVLKKHIAHGYFRSMSLIIINTAQGILYLARRNAMQQ